MANTEEHTADQAEAVHTALIQRLGKVVLHGDTRGLTSDFLEAHQIPSNVMPAILHMMGVSRPSGFWKFSAQIELGVDPEQKTPKVSGRLGSIIFRVFSGFREDDESSQSVVYDVLRRDSGGDMYLHRTTGGEDYERALAQALRDTPPRDKLDAVASVVQQSAMLASSADQEGLTRVTQGEATDLRNFVLSFPASPAPGDHRFTA